MEPEEYSRFRVAESGYRIVHSESLTVNGQASISRAYRLTDGNNSVSAYAKGFAYFVDIQESSPNYLR